MTGFILNSWASQLLYSMWVAGWASFSFIKQNKTKHTQLLHSSIPIHCLHSMCSFIFTHKLMCLCCHICKLAKLCTSTRCATIHYIAWQCTVGTLARCIWLTLTRLLISLKRNGFQWLSLYPRSLFPPKCPAVAAVDSCFSSRTNLSCPWPLWKALVDF